MEELEEGKKIKLPEKYRMLTKGNKDMGIDEEILK